MSVYRDLLKQVDQKDPVSSPPLNAGLEMDPMQQDLESLCSQLEHMATKVRIVCFTGIDAGIGTSSITASVAQLLDALHPGRVLLIDANSRTRNSNALSASVPGDSFHRHCLGELNDIPRAGGVAILSTRDTSKSMSSLPAGTLQKTIQNLREHFNWILVDAPQFNAPESLYWMTAGDGTILVMESNRTRRQHAQIAVEQLKNLNVNILGAVLNRRKMVIPTWIYERLFK